MNESIIRKQLLALLVGGNAHLPYVDVIREFPIEQINSKVGNISYSAWELLEHMRIAQRDIINFIKEKNYVEMKWPDEYWAKKDKAATANDWSASSKMFMDDLNELKTIVEDREIDLFLPLPHGDEYTIFREILLVADHNSYHIGQLMCLKRALE